MKPIKTKPIIVMKKTKKKVARGKRTISKGRGLPSFQMKSKPATTNETTSDNDDQDDEFGEFPCDTLLAFQSLQTNSQGLHIPLLGGRFVQAVLEAQLFRRFEENHGTTIFQEVLELIQSNKLVRISCQDEGQIAFVTSDDYIAAIWDAYENHKLETRDKDNSRIRPAILSWFVGCLQEWRESTISEASMEACWKNDIIVQSGTTEMSISFRNALTSLLKLQVLLKVPITSMASTESHYRLWLPQWGLALKQWDKARRDMMACVNRSSGGEISEMNLLNFNRHSCVSTQFLLNDLLSKGKVRIVERPFGKFVRRVVEE